MLVCRQWSRLCYTPQLLAELDTGESEASCGLEGVAARLGCLAAWLRRRAAPHLRALTLWAALPAGSPQDLKEAELQPLHAALDEVVHAAFAAGGGSGLQQLALRLHEFGDCCFELAAWPAGRSALQSLDISLVSPEVDPMLDYMAELAVEEPGPPSTTGMRLQRRPLREAQAWHCRPR